ncbi:MAG: hypothetical protein DRR11_16870 [Gammaproteobacteria bacterium]|nr:MAG: hypothetical protein DRR11_16870 [Gammaproteobacteria bacterium]
MLLWAIAFSLLPLGLGNPGATTNSIFPALTTTWSFNWLIVAVFLIGLGFFVAVWLIQTWIDEMDR